MTVPAWKRIITEAAGFGVEKVQFIGGEVTMHPDLPELVNYALSAGLAVDIFSNLVHVTDAMWDVFLDNIPDIGDNEGTEVANDPTASRA